MKAFRSSFAMLSIACAAAFATFSAAVVAPMDAAVNAVVSSYHWLRDFVTDGLISLASAEPPRSAPRVLIIAARAFVDRCVKRERPTVTAQWRMVPST